MPFSVCIISALLYGSSINFSPSYNLLTSAGMNILVGSLLAVAGSNTNLVRNLNIILASVGVTLIVLTKPQSGLLLFLVSAIFIATSTSGHRSTYAIFFTVITCSVTLLIIQTFGGAEKFLNQQLFVYSLYKSAISNSFTSMATDYLRGIIELLKLGLAMPFTLMWFFAKKFHWVIFPIFVIENVSRTWFLGKTIEPFLSILIVIMVTALVHPREAVSRNWQHAATILFLFVAPLTLAFASTNDVVSMTRIFLAPWGMCAVFLVKLLIQPKCLTWCYALLCLFCLCAVTQFINVNLKDPYQTADFLVNENIKVDTETMGVVWVSSGTVDYLLEANKARAVCGFGPGERSVATFHNPGIALALNTNPVVSPWINNNLQLRQILSYQRWMPGTPLVVALQVRYGGSIYKSIDIPGFPQNFKYCGSVTYPFAQQTSFIYFHSGKEPSLRLTYTILK